MTPELQLIQNLKLVGVFMVEVVIVCFAMALGWELIRRACGRRQNRIAVAIFLLAFLLIALFRSKSF